MVVFDLVEWNLE